MQLISSPGSNASCSGIVPPSANVIALTGPKDLWVRNSVHDEGHLRTVSYPAVVDHAYIRRNRFVRTIDPASKPWILGQRSVSWQNVLDRFPYSHGSRRSGVIRSLWRDLSSPTNPVWIPDAGSTCLHWLGPSSPPSVWFLSPVQRPNQPNHQHPETIQKRETLIGQIINSVHQLYVISFRSFSLSV
jgi:hypothetical protein